MADPPPSKPESEAVHLLYRRRFPDATGDLPHEVAMELLREVREHAAKIESAALDILRRETRNPPSRGYYSKQMQFFFVRVLPLVLLVAALTAVLMWVYQERF